MQLPYNSKFKPQRQHRWMISFKRHSKRISIGTAVVATLILLIWSFAPSSSSKFAFGKASTNQVKHHSYFVEDIPCKSALIFPSIEHAPFLREMGVDFLFKYTIDQDGNKKYELTEPIPPQDQKLNKATDEAKQMVSIKNSFLQHGRQKFEGPRSPKVVIVTGIDFETNELPHLTKLVQNRVNYAQEHGYGVYVRWLQEFLPILQAGPNNDYKMIARLHILRNAMYAFPDAQYFWYLAENSLIMKYDVDLLKYMLAPEALEPVLLRDQPLIPPHGVIHTYKNQGATDVDLVITQSEGTLNCDSFILQHTFFAKSLVEFWSDSLFRKYHNFPKTIESSLLHILQWHPVYLARTGLVPQRTIASIYSLLTEGEDDSHFVEGDFVVDLKGCGSRGTCGEGIDKHWQMIEEHKA